MNLIFLLFWPSVSPYCFQEKKSILSQIYDCSWSWFCSILSLLFFPSIHCVTKYLLLHFKFTQLSVHFLYYSGYIHLTLFSQRLVLRQCHMQHWFSLVVFFCLFVLLSFFFNTGLLECFQENPNILRIIPSCDSFLFLLVLV